MTTDDPIRVLAADPPWCFDDKLPGGGRGADKHYDTLELYEIQRFPLPPIGHVALLALWRVASMVEDAYAVVRAWGFTPKSEIVWAKTGREVAPFALGEDDPGVDASTLAMGMGHYVRGSHEVAILATRGRFAVADKAVRSVIFAPRGEHSAKPDLFYELLERLGGAGPFCEVFGRKPRPGWLVIGNELPEGRVWMPRETKPAPAAAGRMVGADRVAPTPPPALAPVDPAPPPEVPIDRLAPGDVVAASYQLRDAWGEAQAAALLAGDGDDDDPAEIARLPPHRVRRVDGAIVRGLCAECLSPQYASPVGVVCTRGHGGVASVPELAPSTPAPLPATSAANDTPAASSPRATPAVSGPASDTAPPDAPDPKRAALVERARLEGLLKAEDLAEGLHAAWIKLQYRAPRGWFPPARWFAGPPGPPFLDESRVDLLVFELAARGIPATLRGASKWSALRRSLAYRWVVEGGETPEWLQKLTIAPDHLDQCAVAGCIGVEGGCPAATRAWEEEPAAPPERRPDAAAAPPAAGGDSIATAAAAPDGEGEGDDESELFPSEIVQVPAENMGELPRTARRASNGNGKAKKRGRPPGSRNKPKPKATADAWSAAAAATSFSIDPEPHQEEAFFS